MLTNAVSNRNDHGSIATPFWVRIEAMSGLERCRDPGIQCHMTGVNGHRIVIHSAAVFRVSSGNDCEIAIEAMAQSK